MMRFLFTITTLVLFCLDASAAGRRSRAHYSSSTTCSQSSNGAVSYSHHESYRGNIPEGDALAEVNAYRAQRGLRPFLPDPALSMGAQAAAQFRAERGIVGHTSNDFQFLPPGSQAAAAGCGAWAPGTGWGTCCTYDNYTYAGAGWAIGRDGRRYMHLLVR